MPAPRGNAQTAEMTNPLFDEAYLGDLRRQMLKFATLQLSDPTQAEDAVQEALVGALKNVASFGGRAALKSWVFAILKNKIADTLRQRHRLIDASSLLREEDAEQDFADLFNDHGHWPRGERPKPWSTPDELLHEAHFWRVFEVCLENLPGSQGRAFMMREFIEFDSDEICRTLDISESNLNVMLYRARMRLRECLNINWFMTGE